MHGAQKTPPRLAVSAFGCFLQGAILLAIGLAGFVPEYSRAVSDRALDRIAQTTTRSTALEFARALHADWQAVHHLAQSVGTMSPESARAALDGLTGSGARTSWAGLAGLDGRVIAGSGGLLDGADVSARPWFEAGLRGGFAGDVHDAVLLNRLLGGNEEDPIRFIDFALPVEDAGGNVMGVLASHTSFAWVEAFLTESAAVRDIDLYLVNANGQLIFATDEAHREIDAVAALRAAVMGVVAQTREIWPDGREYFATTVPQVAYGDLPGFGWRLVGRVPGDAFAADQRALFGTLFAIIAGGVAMFGATVALFVLVFVRPITRLVHSAEQVAGGTRVYPPESRSSAEAMRLSGALVRIQSRLDTRDGRHGNPDGPDASPSDPR